MSPPRGIDIGDLNEPARILAHNVETLDAASNTAPQLPDAGTSTGPIGAVIASLAQAMADLASSSARAVDAVQACDDEYTETDNTNGAIIVDATEGPR